MKRQLLLALALCLAIFPALAMGPVSIARADRSLWPDGIASVAGYNRASRAELLVFVGALVELAAKDEQALKANLHIKSVDRTSVERVRDRLLLRLQENYAHAQASCQPDEAFCPSVDSVASLLASSRELPQRLPAQYRSWFASALAFHRQYAAELIRLAALFPKISSEIDTFGSQERNGMELADGHFLWTFDDGPTPAGGATDMLLPVLERAGIHGMFFVLGERLQQRLRTDGSVALQQRYAGQCVALHGWAHQSHQTWSRWQASIQESHELATRELASVYRPYFRPPYGQRRADSGTFLAAKQISAALWNIDSQDWNAKLNADEAAQRVLTLMLLWRRGTILFHDIHPKAAASIPWLVAQTQNAGLVWEDCRQY